MVFKNRSKLCLIDTSSSVQYAARSEEERVRRRGKEDTVRVQGGYSGDTVRLQWGTVRVHWGHSEGSVGVQWD